MEQNNNQEQNQDEKARSVKRPRIKIPTFQEIERGQQEQNLGNVTHSQLQQQSYNQNSNTQHLNQNTAQQSNISTTTKVSNTQHVGSQQEQVHQQTVQQSQQHQQVYQQQQQQQQINKIYNNSQGVRIQNYQQQYPATALVVNNNQKGNPLLPYIRHVGHVFGDIIPDYLVGENTGVLFLSLRFHKLHKNHIRVRIKQLAHAYRAYLLCHVDVDDPHVPLMDITKLAIDNQLTLICAFSNRECARYLETLKAFENKPADSIKERLQDDQQSRIEAAFTMIRGVNKTDCATMGTKFGTVGDILKGSSAEFSSCPGIGPAKAKRLQETFNTPLIKNKTIIPKQQQQQITNIENDVVEDAISEDSDMDDFEDEL